MRRKSLGQIDNDINSETGEYSSQQSMEDSRYPQSRHSVTDGESLASSVEAEYEERLSEATSDATSVGTQGSMDVAKKPPKISDRLTQYFCCCGFKRSFVHVCFLTFKLSISIAELSRWLQGHLRV